MEPSRLPAPNGRMRPPPSLRRAFAPPAQSSASCSRSKLRCGCRTPDFVHNDCDSDAVASTAPVAGAAEVDLVVCPARGRNAHDRPTGCQALLGSVRHRSEVRVASVRQISEWRATRGDPASIATQLERRLDAVQHASESPLQRDRAPLRRARTRGPVPIRRPLQIQPSRARLLRGASSAGNAGAAASLKRGRDRGGEQARATRRVDPAGLVARSVGPKTPSLRSISVGSPKRANWTALASKANVARPNGTGDAARTAREPLERLPPSAQEPPVGRIAVHDAHSCISVDPHRT